MESQSPERSSSRSDLSACMKPGAHIHFMGICGTAMASLAGLLHERGYKVTGSDQNVYPPMSTQLEGLGIRIMEGYKKENLNVKPDLVIVGNVITRNHEEAQALLASGIPYTSLPRAMGELVIADRHSIVVSGTHGKTTTTALLSWLAETCGLMPGFLIGGVPKNFAHSYQVPKGDWFVIEGDEYDTAFFDKVPKFTHYRPRTAILTSVEFDHADIYHDLAAVKGAFSQLLKLLPAGGLLVCNAEDENIAGLLDGLLGGNIPDAGRLSDAGLVPATRARVVTFGLNKGDYQARAIRSVPQGTEFDVVVRGEKRAHLATRMIGDYNIKNALAAFATACELGWPVATVVRAISSFMGVKRRQEIIGCPNGITIIEDFAHHPTAVKGTIESVQARHPNAHVFSVFEARSATSRRKFFQQKYAEALGVAQTVLLPPPFNQANIPEADRFSNEILVRDLRDRGVDVEQCDSIEQIVAHLAARAKTGDVILIMSNGGFGGIYEKLLAAL